MSNLPAPAQGGSLVPRDPYEAHGDTLIGPGNDGEILKFAKGRWTAGKDDRPMDDAKLVARTDIARTGARKWWEKKIVGSHAGFVGDGYRPPPRDQLGDTDQSLWPKDPNGKPQDPWQEFTEIQLQGPGDPPELYVWTATSKGAAKEAGILLKAYGRERRRNPTALPVVQLSSDFYKHEIYGRVDTPSLDIVGWVDEATGTKIADKPAAPDTPDTPRKFEAKPATQATLDLDDEIPF